GRAPCPGGPGPGARHVDRVVGGRAVDLHLVGGEVAAAEVDVDVLHVGRAQIADIDGVGTAEGLEVDVLDAVGVHGDVGDVAGESEAVAVRREGDVLGDVGAVEAHRVGAGVAFDRVAAVARVPDERVVTGAERTLIGAAVAVDDVVAAAAEKCLRTAATGEVVVAVAAVEDRRDRVGEDAVRVVDPHDVVAARGVDDDVGHAGALEVAHRAVAPALQCVGRAGRGGGGDLVVCARAFHGQRAVPELRLLELIIPVSHRSVGHACDEGPPATTATARRTTRAATCFSM